jgi:hypothetical protein
MMMPIATMSINVASMMNCIPAVPLNRAAKNLDGCWARGIGGQ